MPNTFEPGALTPVDEFSGPLGPWFAKREDYAGQVGSDYPGGAKVRQFFAMAKEQPGAPMLVGCSANSAMQIYIAAAARVCGVPGIVYVPARKAETAATRYAREMGAEVNLVRPGYLSCVRKAARERAKALGSVVRWRPALAVTDTAAQCANIPAAARRVVVPVGTGAIAAGLLVGLADSGRPDVEVVGVAVSPMATAAEITANAAKFTARPLPPFSLGPAGLAYDDPMAAALPDGSPLDPYYAAKTLVFIQPYDCLWVSGVRPAGAWPEI